MFQYDVLKYLFTVKFIYNGNICSPFNFENRSFVKMSNIKLHMKIYKAVVMLLVVVFSLSPCSLKRNVLDIFDIQHISALNKTKTTAPSFSGCESFNSSSKISVSKADFKFKGIVLSDFLQSVNFNSEKPIFSQKSYSGNTSGNSPPKYILFKRLKLDMV